VRIVPQNANSLILICDIILLVLLSLYAILSLGLINDRNNWSAAMRVSRRRFLAASAAVPLFAPTVVLAQAKEFRLGLITPNGHSWNQTAVKLGEDLKAASNGRLTMTVFHSGQLGNESAMMQQLQTGALDMGFIQAAELGLRVPHIAAINAPYIVRSTPAVAKLVRHPVAMKLFDVLPQRPARSGSAGASPGCARSSPPGI
jgi:TRAP-type C4-dicarboxylate transport system substrate-binding protein